MYAYGHAADNSQNGVFLGGSGTDIVFVNTQIVAIGSGGKRYIYTAPGFSGSASFFQTTTWAGTDGSSFDGSGSVTLVQYQDKPDDTATGPYISQNGGAMRIDASVFQKSANQISLSSSLSSSASFVYFNAGKTSFGVSNGSGAPNVWMNIPY